MFIMQAGPYDNLRDIVLKILQSEVSTVPIIHSSSEDGSFPQLLHLASLSGILKCKLLKIVFFIPSLSMLDSHPIDFFRHLQVL